MNNDKQTLSSVKKQILEKLREKEWVSSKELLVLTNQKYFDRRIRELRDENGYDIVTKHIDGEPHYSLQSEKRKPPKPRTYLSQKEKKQVLDNSPEECVLCGKEFSDDLKPVFDHRVPLIKGGQGNIDNFQLLCNECNNQKRSQCRNCEFDCTLCYLAFPEKFPKAILLRPDKSNLWEKISEQAKQKDMSTEDFIIQFLKDHI